MLPETSKLCYSFRGVHCIVVSGHEQGRLQLTCDGNTLASFQLPSSNPVASLFMQPLDVLGRFSDDLLYFWADCSTGRDPRIDLVCIKLRIGSNADAKVHSSAFCSCFCIDDATMLVNSSLLSIQSMGSIYGSNSVLFFHFKSRTTATIQTAVLDAAAVLAHAEKIRKSEPTRFKPSLSSVQTVPVPTEETSEKLIPVSSTVQAGSVSVLRVYPLLAHPESAGDSGSGSSSLSSESVVISCSYTTVVSYTRAGKPSEVVNCVSKLVTAEDQIRTILSYRGVEILSNPDCEVSLENTCSTDAPRLGPRAQVIYPRTVLLGLGQLHSVGAVPVIRGKLYQICLDLGLIVRDRRDAIDKLMKGEISTSKLSEKLSKNTARRIIILETCLSCNLVNTICEYITALDSARFGYRHSSTSKSAEMIHSYANVQDYLSGGSGVENSGPREATAAGVDVGYVLRDVTRVHQWAVLLLEQLRTMAKDTILLRFVVPYLIAKGDNITGSAHITDMPVGYTRELASYICLCEGAVAVFRALVTRKTMEVISAAAAIEEEAEHETFTAAVPWTATSLLDGQCVVAEAVVAVLKIASLACSTRGVSLPRQQSPSLLRNHDERTQADPEYLQLADNICDIQSFFGDVSAQMFKQRSNYSTPTLMLIQDLLVQYIDKFCRVVTDSDTASFISRSGYLSATLGDVRNREDTSPAELSRHADRLSALLYSPVILALTVQKQGLKFAAANLGLTLSSAASREEALDIFYIPIRHALASIEYTLLDTIDITCGAYDENAIFGFAGKFGCACGSQAGKSLSPTFLFPPSWSQSVAAIWMIESGFSTTVSIQVLQSYSFESFFESSSAIYRMQSSCFLPISPEVLFRYVLHRFLFRGDWKSAKSLLRSQTSAGGTAGGLGIETYDLTPLLLSPENKLNFGPSSRARCIILTLGLAMLQLDEWQSAWHTTRKLCYGQSDLISVELIDMFCKWLFFYNKATEIINFTFMEEDHLIIESKLKEFAEHRVADAITSKDDTDSVAIVVDGQRNPDSTGFVFDARAIEACDVYILYLISRNKINEASDVAIGSRLKGYISPDVSELLTANAAFTHVITRDFCAILPSESKKTTAEQVLAVGNPKWESPDGISSFEHLLGLKN